MTFVAATSTVAVVAVALFVATAALELSPVRERK